MLRAVTKLIPDKTYDKNPNHYFFNLAFLNSFPPSLKPLQYQTLLHHMQGIDGLPIALNKFRTHLEPQQQNVTCVSLITPCASDS